MKRDKNVDQRQDPRSELILSVEENGDLERQSEQRGGQEVT